jgi:hypothetical protein
LNVYDKHLNEAIFMWVKDWKYRTKNDTIIFLGYGSTSLCVLYKKVIHQSNRFSEKVVKKKYRHIRRNSSFVDLEYLLWITLMNYHEHHVVCHNIFEKVLLYQHLSLVDVSNLVLVWKKIRIKL